MLQGVEIYTELVRLLDCAEIFANLEMAGLDYNVFPRMKIDSGDVTGSWNSWWSEFQVAVATTTIKMGTEDVNGAATPRFRGPAKLMALAMAIGVEGRDTLMSQGIDIMGENATFDASVTSLRTHYGREESIYVRTMKFVTANQTCGESDRDYLLRIERLSRTVEMGTDDTVRQRFALVLAVNGLRDATVRQQLMQEQDLTWAQLRTKLTARDLARESENIISGSRTGSNNVKREVKVEVDRVEGGYSGDNVEEYNSSRDRERYVKGITEGRQQNQTYARNRSRSNSGDSYRFSPTWEDRSRGQSNTRYKSGRYERGNSPRRYYRSYRQRREDSPYRSDRQRREDSPYSRDYPSRRSTWGNKDRPSSPISNDMICFECDKVGHQVRNCPQARCFTCNRKGHTSKDCPRRSPGYTKYRNESRYDSNESSDGGKSPPQRVRFTNRESDE